MPSRSSIKGQVSTKRWPLQDAKAHLSELVRKAHDEGPQHITVHGRDAAVLISDADYLRLKGERLGSLLVELLANSPLSDVEFGRAEVIGPVRDVEL